MSQQLINHSPDLKRLQDEGYEIEVHRGGFLLIHHVPYVNKQKAIAYGTLVSELSLAHAERTSRPNTHVIAFIGDHPCNKNGTEIGGIKHASNTERLAIDLTINHRFSNKPQQGYSDYYEKFIRYIEIISAPAKAIDPNVTATTFRRLVEAIGDTAFVYSDTNSSRANVSGLTEKFRGKKVAIIGLGGTGAYILDLVAKTPVSNIYIFDGDDFLQHNAFRFPGAASGDCLKKGQKKVEYLFAQYSQLHKGIVPHAVYVTAENIHLLKDVDFVFVCIDNNAARKTISEALLIKGLPFIDVGLGVNIVEDMLIGAVRVTTATLEKNDHLQNRLPVVENENNEYTTNVQIADLNALNAVLAVIKWKKLWGFYQDLEGEHHSSYSLNISDIINEDRRA